MKNHFLLLALLFMFNLSYGQNDFIHPGQKNLKFAVDISLLPSEKTTSLVQKLENIEFVKDVTASNSQKIEFTYDDHYAILPNAVRKQMAAKILDYTEEYGISLNFLSNNDVLAIFKPELISHKTILLADINTSNDRIALENNLLVHTEVLCVNFNMETHELFIIYSNIIDESIFNEMIKSTGKQIITSSQDLSKYY